MIELAVVLPLLTLVVVGGLILGLATVSRVRLQHAVSVAASSSIEESEVAALVSDAGGTLTCFWQGPGPGGCWDDGLAAERRQVVADGPVYQHPGGSVQPTARAVGMAE